MGAEAQSVIALRMLRLAAGGHRMEAEATRMVTEKVAAATEAQLVAAVAAISGTRNTLSRIRRSRLSENVYALISGGYRDAKCRCVYQEDYHG